MILDESLFQDYDTEMNQSSAVYHCDTAAQRGTVSKLEALAKKLGVPLRFGTTVGKSPQTIILDYKYQDCAVSVNSNGSFEINGEEFGSYDSYFSFSRVNIDDVKDALLSLKAEASESEESLTESEESSSEFYGVFEKGGSIGKSYATRDDLHVWSGRDAGTLVKVFSSSDEAKNYAKRMRSTLSPGERSYYGMGYFVKKLSKKNLEHPQVIDMISNMPRSSASQVDKESMNESANELSSKAILYIEVMSGVNADGFTAIVADSISGEEIFRQTYYYGYTASYDRRWASSRAPYVTDIINDLKSRYNVSNVEVTAGKNLFRGDSMSSDSVEKFKNKYLNESISLSDDQLDKAMELVDKIYEACKSIYSYNENGKFEEGLNLNEWSIYSAAADLHDILESGSLTESAETDETPWSYKEVEDALKNLSNNWRDKSGVCRCWYKEEKQHAVKILRKHYKIVETSQDGGWTVIAFETPI